MFVPKSVKPRFFSLIHILLLSPVAAGELLQLVVLHYYDNLTLVRCQYFFLLFLDVETFMFWDNFYRLCRDHDTKPNPVAKELGFSSATVTKWKNGTSPNLNAVTDIAGYFHVTVDELLNGAPAKCYRCGYEYNPHNASYCKKCGEILHNNFCTNLDCDADGTNSPGATHLSDDCEYCPYCGCESKYKIEGLFDAKDTKSDVTQKDSIWLTLIHKLTIEQQNEVKGYINRIIESSVAADDSIKKTGTTNSK